MNEPKLASDSAEYRAMVDAAVAYAPKPPADVATVASKALGLTKPPRRRRRQAAA